MQAIRMSRIYAVPMERNFFTPCAIISGIPWNFSLDLRIFGLTLKTWNFSRQSWEF